MPGYKAGDSKLIFEPFLKNYQRKLLKKQYKVYTLLRFHRIFENERYFGKTMNYLSTQMNQQLFNDYFYFKTENLKENKF